MPSTDAADNDDGEGDGSGGTPNGGGDDAAAAPPPPPPPTPLCGVWCDGVVEYHAERDWVVFDDSKLHKVKMAYC